MADEEEEAKKRETQQLLSGFLELKTRKENKKTNLNELKVDIQWQELMREAKSKELQADLQLMKVSFTKAVDIKDSIIAALEKEIDEVEVENMWTACNQMRSLEELIGIEKQRSQRLQLQYEKGREELKKSLKQTKQEIDEKFKFELSLFKDLDFIEDTVFRDFSDKTKTHFSLIYEDVNWDVSKEKTDILRSFDCNIGTTWMQFQSALVKYLEDADMMEKLFVELKQEYKESMLDTLQDQKDTEELQTSIPLLKSQIEQREKDHKERVQKFLMGNDDFYSNAADVKNRMAKIQIHDKISLTKLVVNSTACIRELQKLDSKGERIIRLYKRCEKLEAETGGQGLALDEPVLTPDELKDVKNNFNFEFPANGVGKQPSESFKYIGLLQGFWEKQNKVVLQNLALKRELGDLEVVHMQLKKNMSKFFKKVAKGDTERDK